ncbi:MAG: MFS transporter [Ilumatobacteraceae bacterium]|nr:MFS transporter [Ilumatobacteraceae bacterium]
MSALRSPLFRRLAVAWTFSNFGDSVLYLTLAIWVKDLTHSNTAAGLVFLFLGLPVLFAPLAGQLADRYSRRKIVIGANVIEAAVVLALVFVHGRSDLWLIYAVTFVYGFLTYVTSAAGSGLVRDLLSDDQLASGNGLLSTIDQGLHLLSPLLGAGVYGLFGGAALAVTTSTILIAAALLTVTVRLIEHISTGEREAFWPEITAGVRHIRRVPVLARVTTAMGVALLVTGFANIAIFAVIDQGLHRSSEFFGVLASIQGAGSVLGGLTAAAVIARLGERGAMAVGLGLLGIALAFDAIASTAVVVAAEVVVGIVIPWMLVAFTTLRQRVTPPELQGRVSSATNMALNGPQTIGTAVGAALIAIVDYRVLIISMGVVIAACAVPIAARRTEAAPEQLVRETA